MVYLVEEPDPGEIIIVEAKGGSSPLGSRKIGNEAYQQGTSKYAAEIVKLMSENKEVSCRRNSIRRFLRQTYSIYTY